MKLAQYLLRPMEIARKIQQQINHPDITKVDVASPGFINFFTTEDYNQIIELILSGDKHFFKPDIGHGHQVYLEFVSANPTGPLHVGHGRSAAYGSTLANIYAPPISMFILNITLMMLAFRLIF